MVAQKSIEMMLGIRMIKGDIFPFLFSKNGGWDPKSAHVLCDTGYQYVLLGVIIGLIRDGKYPRLMVKAFSPLDQLAASIRIWGFSDDGEWTFRYVACENIYCIKRRRQAFKL